MKQGNIISNLYLTGFVKNEKSRRDYSGVHRNAIVGEHTQGAENHPSPQELPRSSDRTLSVVIGANDICLDFGI